MDIISLKNLATKNTTYFTITGNGDAFISQTKVAILCGVGQNSISQFIAKTRDTLQVNDSNQLSHNSLELVIGHYAFDSQRINETALSNYRMLAKAGAKAYIYHEAGYVMEAKPAIPQNFSEALQLAADQAKEIQTLEKQARIDAPKVKFAEILTENSNTRCIRVWVKGMKSDYGLRVGERDVFNWLREKKYIFKDRTLGNLPCARYESNGLSYFSLAGFEDKQGVVRQSLQITGKGMVSLTDKVIKHFSDNNELSV